MAIGAIWTRIYDESYAVSIKLWDVLSRNGHDAKHELALQLSKFTKLHARTVIYGTRRIWYVDAP